MAMVTGINLENIFIYFNGLFLVIIKIRVVNYNEPDILQVMGMKTSGKL